MRKSMHVVVFLIMLNASSGMLIASGLATDMGVLPQTGGDDKIERVNEVADNPNPGGGAGGTLFGLFTSVGGITGDILVLVFAGPVLFENLGIPVFLAVFMFAPAPVIVGADLLYVFSGRDI